ncbi:hypothetical protein B296_00007969 [Ensete ventricosum]|uniref:Uncharacterized protein n=1 Tax=Ensete ventricosum TaxID=4639 RepID=A0A427AVK2_ENSVE|nr:hypothetical protein B296_00007969 [Ensete ventricosum]
MLGRQPRRHLRWSHVCASSTARSTTMSASEVEASGRCVSLIVTACVIKATWRAIPSSHTSAPTDSPYNSTTPKVMTKPNVPRQPPQSEVAQPMSIRGEKLEDEGPRLPPTKDTLENPNTSAAQPTSRYRDIAQVPHDLDVISSDSTDLVREQLPHVNHKLDEVRKEFAKSKEEVGESSKVGSPFVPEIQDESVLPGF